MNCKHDRLRTVGNRVFCCSCGTELDIAFLKAKNKPGKTAPDAGANKAPAKKRPAKKAEKGE